MARKWHKGPPPHRGWWNASVGRDNKAWRWWDGRHWSSHVTDECYAKDAEFYASIKYTFQDIEWSDYYPPNARVPRINPDE